MKSKPGIGRPRRYQSETNNLSSSESGDLDIQEFRDHTITVEKLFQLPTEQIRKLFEATAKQRLQARKKNKDKSANAAYRCNSDICCSTIFGMSDTNRSEDTDRTCTLRNIPSVSLRRFITSSTTNLLSKKPIVCPHGHCHKVVTISSFFQHFKHDHSEIPNFIAERGKELHLMHDVRIIEFDTTYCMAIIKVYEVYNVIVNSSSKQLTTLAERLNQKVPLATFWLMVSGSSEEKKSKSFVLYWLMTNSDEHFSCTMEMSSMQENICNSTVCPVNGILDSHKIDDVAHRLNCLNLCYASLHNLLGEGSKLHLRVTIH